jgi:hypothetical protein
MTFLTAKVRRTMSESESGFLTEFIERQGCRTWDALLEGTIPVAEEIAAKDLAKALQTLSTVQPCKPLRPHFSTFQGSPIIQHFALVSGRTCPGDLPRLRRSRAHDCGILRSFCGASEIEFLKEVKQPTSYMNWRKFVSKKALRTSIQIYDPISLRIRTQENHKHVPSNVGWLTSLKT